MESQYIEFHTNLVIMRTLFPDGSWLLVSGNAVSSINYRNNTDPDQFLTESRGYFKKHSGKIFVVIWFGNFWTKFLDGWRTRPEKQLAGQLCWPRGSRGLRSLIASNYTYWATCITLIDIVYIFTAAQRNVYCTCVGPLLDNMYIFVVDINRQCV